MRVHSTNDLSLCNLLNITAQEETEKIKLVTEHMHRQVLEILESIATGGFARSLLMCR
jgi:hypothetical protein